jgi:hypothetical protein
MAKLATQLLVSPNMEAKSSIENYISTDSTSQEARMLKRVCMKMIYLHS